MQNNNTKQYFSKFDETSHEIFVLLEEDFKRNNPQGRLCSEEIAVWVENGELSDQFLIMFSIIYQLPVWQDLDECNIVFCLLFILEDFSSVFNTTAHDYSIAAAIVTGFDWTSALLPPRSPYYAYSMANYCT